jgi:LacI family transcriptional regulator
MAAAAVTLLAQMAGGAQLADEVVELPTVLVARGSTGRPR